MELREHTYKIKGMNMDLSNSIFSPEFSWRNKNIRLTVRGSNDTLLVSNERGNKVLSVNEYFRDPAGIKYTYTANLLDYVNTISQPVYTYSSTMSGYVDTKGSPSYTYSAAFSNYVDTIGDPTYLYKSSFSDYADTKVNI